MRIKRPPPQLPQAYQAPTSRGPSSLGSRQAEYASRLRQAQTWKTRKDGKARGINDPELVTEFDEAMDEAYDRLLGRRKRQEQQHQQQQHEPEQQAEAAPELPKGRELPAAFRFTPMRLKG